jgi:hypothetical protein
MAVRGWNRTDDGGEVRNDNWFAKQLGDGWQTSGDGIYTYVGESAEPSDSELPDDDRGSRPAANPEHSLSR